VRSKRRRDTSPDVGEDRKQQNERGRRGNPASYKRGGGTLFEIPNPQCKYKRIYCSRYLGEGRGLEGTIGRTCKNLAGDRKDYLKKGQFLDEEHKLAGAEGIRGGHFRAALANKLRTKELLLYSLIIIRGKREDLKRNKRLNGGGKTSEGKKKHKRATPR